MPEEARQSFCKDLHLFVQKRPENSFEHKVHILHKKVQNARSKKSIDKASRGRKAICGLLHVSWMGLPLSHPIYLL